MKYMGSKARFANEILSIILANRYLEMISEIYNYKTTSPKRVKFI